MDILIQYPHTFTNTVELQKEGILHPSRIITSLKRKGAIIETEIRDYKPLWQKPYTRIAHYRFKGWCHDEC